ncbi:hypothetical protein PVAP13_2KG404015 [Panicum virgatum]|uniref:Uncharacterized protein n=1 Tax=Panicum virgatum TaxID=38727 RepID=A0A8T0WCZ9_PANVG|nr:hypothetical protein PVAP13_2KG404015 [Panicum virgatum]
MDPAGFAERLHNKTSRRFSTRARTGFTAKLLVEKILRLQWCAPATRLLQRIGSAPPATNAAPGPVDNAEELNYIEETTDDLF